MPKFNKLTINVNGEKAKIDGIVIPIIELGKSGGKWEKIEEIIRDYTKLHPEEMKAQLELIATLRRLQYNKFASSKSNSLRWGISLPTGLLITIKKFYPEVFAEKKEMEKFMRKFRGFTVCQKI